MNWSIVMNVLFVVLIIAAIVLGVLYYFGRKLEKRQVEAQATIDAAKQVVTLMAIDKKKLKLKDALVRQARQDPGGKSQDRSQDHDHDRR